MRRLAFIGLALATPFVLTGCGATLMREASSQNLSTPAEQRVKLVFMRTSMVAGAIGCDLFEVLDGGELKFIGQLPTGNKVVYETSPGKKVFMAYGTAADFMLADLTPGKTYYSIVRPNWGTGGFAPTPIRTAGMGEYQLDSKEVQGWLTSTKALEPTDSAQKWLTENRSRLNQTYAEYWSRFQRKSAQEQAERTMNPQDGR